MQNKTVFLTVMLIFVYSAFRMWQGLSSGEYTILRLISLVLILAGIIFMLYGRMKAFVREIRKNGNL